MIHEPTSVPGRLVVAVMALVVGVAVGVCAVALHQRWWGLVLGVAAAGAALAAIPGGWWSRLPFALGFVSALGALTVERPEGDYLVASDAAGYLLLGAGLLVLLAGLVGLRPRPGGRADSGHPPQRT